MTQGEKITNFIDDHLYQTNVHGKERVAAEIAWESSVAVDINFISVYRNHGDYAETQIGTTTLRKGKNMYKDYVEAKNDWSDYNPVHGIRFELPDLSEEEFNEIVGRNIKTTIKHNIKSDERVLLLI